ncbi:MAG: hypothetical protein WKF83_16935 [Nocardioidaceae bacterium]
MFDEDGERVDRSAAANTHLEVQVRSGGVARVSDGAQLVAGGEPVADLDVDGVEVPKPQVDAVCQPYHNAVAVRPVVVRPPSRRPQRSTGPAYR